MPEGLCFANRGVQAISSCKIGWDDERDFVKLFRGLRGERTVSEGQELGK